MLDLETMGTNPYSVIWQIGACRFDERGVRDRVHLYVCQDSCKAIGMTCDVATAKWWGEQSSEARCDMDTPAIPIKTALEMFAIWIGDDARIWGNGAGFDNVILASAYELADMELPWKYSSNLDCRTLRFLAPNVKRIEPKVKHNAISDAVAQAEHMLSCLKDLGRTLVNGTEQINKQLNDEAEAKRVGLYLQRAETTNEA